MSNRAKYLALTAGNGGVAPTDAHDSSTYVNWGCRCPDCRAGHATMVRQRRAARRRIVAANGGQAPIELHGVSAYTNWGCRCEVCRLSWNAAHRARREEVTANG